MELAKYIEHTSLKPVITDTDILKLISEAIQFGFKGICVPPFWVKKAARELAGSQVRLVTVVGFPFGYNMTEVKLEEAKIAIENGADELDVVMNISAFKAGMNWVKIELARLAEQIHRKERFMKVILETGYLTADEISKAARISVDAGADFIKTSTGFGPRGATVEDIEIIAASIPAGVGIKASGGIRTREQAEALIRAGASRVGTSNGIELLG